MFKKLFKNQEPTSKLSNLAGKSIQLNETELKKVLGGGNGGTTTITPVDKSKSASDSWSSQS